MPPSNPSAIATFARIFPGQAPCRLVRAPGRVNLIGEHVDYHDGFVLPIAMSQALYVVAAPADDGHIEAYTTAFDQRVRFPADDPGPPQERGWTNYVRGVAEMLRRRGVALRPGKLLIDSQVPLGGGVSSSAALEVGTALALLALADAKVPPVELALLCRQAEHEYADSPCGIMDQFICVLGKVGQALLLDCRSQSFEHLPLATDGVSLVVMDTQVKHEIGASQYPVRQKQGYAGLEIVQADAPQVRSLRDVTLAQLDSCKQRMDPIVYRRCRHVVTEIARTRAAADALQSSDLATFGRLMVDSHISLRDDYEVSCEELDALVEIATHVEGCYGARMTGGGFGGCAIALVESAAQQSFVNAVRSQYDGSFEKSAIVYTTAPSEGAGTTRLHED